MWYNTPKIINLSRKCDRNTTEMIALFLLWIVIYLSGRLLCKIGGEKEASQWWIHLTGFFFLFLSQGIVFFIGQFSGRSFGECVRILEFLYGVISLLSLGFCGKELIRESKRLKEWKANNFHDRKPYLLLQLLLAVFWVMQTQWQGNRNDAVIETAAVTLLTDTMNQFHPFTHQPLELGVIFTRRLITLPFWYGAVSHWTGFSVAATVTLVGNISAFVFSLFAMAELGSLLFERDRNYTYWLIIFIELFYLSGDYHPGSEGYSQLYYGYSGETMVMSIVIPMMIIVLYRLLGQYLRHNFDRENQGLDIWPAVLKLILIFGSTVFLAGLKWGVLMLLLSLGIFGIMLLLIAAMKNMAEKREGNK